MLNQQLGFLQNLGKVTRLNTVRQSMDLLPLPPKILVPVAVRILEQCSTNMRLCSVCKTGRLVLVCIIYPKKDATIKPVYLRNKASPVAAALP